METINTDMLRGRVDVFVLNCLNQHDGYGYDILDYIREKTDGHYIMKQSSIYSVLKRLEKQGYISSYDGNESNGGKRRYYTLTQFGKDFLENEKKEWDYTRTLLNNLVSDRNFDLQNDIPPFKPSDLRPLTKRSKENADETTEIVTESSPIVPELSVEQDDTAPNLADENIIENTLTPPTEQIVNVAESVEKPREEIVSWTELEKLSHKQNVKIVEDTKSQSLDEHFRLALQNKKVEAQTISNKETYNNSDYKETLASILMNNSKKQEVKKIDSELDNMDCKHINDLKAMLENEGLNLKSYVPSSNKNFIRNIYINKFYRDLSLLTYMFFVAMLLVIGLLKNSFTSNWIVLLVIGLVAGIAPVFALIQYLNNPLKKHKDNTKLNKILPLCFVFYIAFLVLNIIIGLIIPNGHSLNSPQLYAPSICALVVPFFAVVYMILYKSNNYHQKIK